MRSQRATGHKDPIKGFGKVGDYKNTWIGLIAGLLAFELTAKSTKADINSASYWVAVPFGCSFLR